MRQLYRSGMVVGTAPEALRVRVERACDSCSSGCDRRLPDIFLPGVSGGAPGAQVQLSVSAQALNVNCLALFGPWLLVVAGLIALDLAGVDLPGAAAVALAGGSLALWAGHRLAHMSSKHLSVAVAAEESTGAEDTQKWRVLTGERCA